MADTQSENTVNTTELLATGRRHLAVREYNAAVDSLAYACEALCKEHGDMADQLAEPYLWYGKSLLGLSRLESGVLGDGIPGQTNDEEEDEDDLHDQENGEAEATENGSTAPEKHEEEKEKTEPESTSKDDEPSSSKEPSKDDQPSSSKPQDGQEEAGPSNGDANDESIANLENEDDIDNLQLAWEMLDLSRSILLKRGAGDAAARALLAEVHLALGEVALESETYDKAVIDMQSCLELQKELYGSDDRRIAETHYQIGLANSLASNFEEAITHFKNAANILESRIKTLEDPTTASDEAQKDTTSRGYTVEAEIKELKELLPEIQEKIQDMMDYKAETIKRIRETICPSNGGASASNGASSSTNEKPAANISHLIKRKRKPSETEECSAPKKANT